MEEASKRLYVGNLSYRLNEADFAAAFKDFGELTYSAIVKDRETGRSRGFGFVEFGTIADAQEAMEALNNTELDGRPMNIKNAIDKRDSRGASNSTETTEESTVGEGEGDQSEGPVEETGPSEADQ